MSHLLHPLNTKNSFLKLFFFLLQEGESNVEINGNVNHMKTQDSLLIKSKTNYKHSRPAGSFSLCVTMKFPKK